MTIYKEQNFDGRRVCEEIKTKKKRQMLLDFFNLPNYSASNRNENQKQKKKFLESRAWPVCKADNLTAICEPIV
jgi:hypothetical protein